MSTPLWTSAEIAAATGGQASADFDISGVTFDSREVEAGILFIAMRGENADGHDFIDMAVANGAAGILCEKPIAAPHVLVADAYQAMRAMAVAARQRMSGKVIGVTGSAGKTGTKEALAAALERDAPGKVHKSVKSYNNHTGVPLSLARMPRDSVYAVLEMGMNHSGELLDLTQLVRPHVAIVTTIAPAHVGYFASVDEIADAKAEIFAGLEPGGTAIVPFDSPYCQRLSAAAAAAGAAHIVTFGTHEGADVWARDWVADAESGGSLITAELPGAGLCFALAQPGDHWVANGMAILAAVQAVGADLAAAGLALAELPGLPGRGARYHLPIADGSYLLIDESYNANPASMAVTLAQLGRQPAERRIAVLGAMKELGDESDGYHAALARNLRAANVDFALLVGAEMQPLALALEGQMPFAHGADAAFALERLRPELKAGDAVLVKGSNSVGLSRVVAALIAGGA